MSDECVQQRKRLPPSSEVYDVARALYETKPDVPWDVYFDEIMGRTGAIRRAFPGADRVEFLQSRTMWWVLRMLTLLRECTRPVSKQKVITIRLPSLVHRALRIEAAELATSMNKLAISKLLRPLPNELSPEAEEEIEKGDAQTVTSDEQPSTDA